jgi:hypothetical protein
MLKLLIAVILLIVAALVAGAYLQFNPGFLILAILGFGIFMVGRIGGPPLPPGGKRLHWGSGHGIYFDGDDVWVAGSESDDARRSHDDGARR